MRRWPAGGITKPYPSMLESGARPDPTLHVLKRLTKALRFLVSDLVG